MRLIESEGARERRPGGATMSVVFHAAMIAMAVVGTARADVRLLAPAPDEGVVWSPPKPVEPSRSPTGATTSPGPSAPVPGRVIPVPTVTPTGFPPIDVAVVPVGGTDLPVVFGSAAVSGAGGFDDAARGGGGGGDAQGVWDAPSVDVAVLPDARNPLPRYPETLRTAGLTGRVVAEFVVDSAGRVREGTLAIVEATHPLFASSVRATLPSLRFTPARAQGHRVAQRVRMPFEFEVVR